MEDSEKKHDARACAERRNGGQVECWAEGMLVDVVKELSEIAVGERPVCLGVGMSDRFTRADRMLHGLNESRHDAEGRVAHIRPEVFDES